MADFQDALMRRLSLINELGAAANVRTRGAVNSRRSGGGNFSGGSSGVTGGSDWTSFLNAIASKESGGNYGAVNKSSGALGKYQVMPANVASWSRAALGRSISPQQFLSSPDLQEKVAQAQLKRYFDLYGPQGAAIAWYSGESKAKKFKAGKGVSTRKQGAYPSIANYAGDILRRMR